jgi:hypothetical protein
MFKSSLEKPQKMDDPFLFKVPYEPTLEVPEKDVEETNDNIMCIIKIDGIVFSKTSCNLDMRIVNFKFIEQED